jgi:hypothetical protein
MVDFDRACEVWLDCCEVPELKLPNSAKRSADMVLVGGDGRGKVRASVVVPSNRA